MLFKNTSIGILSLIIYFGVLFGWIYSIGKILNKGEAKTIKRLNLLSIFYLVSVILLGIRIFETLKDPYHTHDQNPILIIFSGIIGLISFVGIGIIGAKSLKKIETNKEPKFEEYAMNLFLILYMLVGVWVLQPKLNKILIEKKSTGNTGYNYFGV